jgi:hypothetical protein
MSNMYKPYLYARCCQPVKIEKKKETMFCNLYPCVSIFDYWTIILVWTPLWGSFCYGCPD